MLMKIKRLWLGIIFESGKLIKAKKSYRGIGKTNMLIKKAQEDGLTIIVGSQQAYDEIKGLTQFVNVLRLKKGYTVELKGKAGGILLDESLDLYMVEWLKKQKEWEIRGGFIREDDGNDN
ncbi:hypothetical protein AB3N02_22775 [Priestia aryabhattai]|uniref:hypothetical protein n=1 Tax=Priestia aryabhattai TaxID=412384 RepID=UPI0039A3AF5F